MLCASGSWYLPSLPLEDLPTWAACWAQPMGSTGGAHGEAGARLPLVLLLAVALAGTTSPSEDAGPADDSSLDGCSPLGNLPWSVL